MLLDKGCFQRIHADVCLMRIDKFLPAGLVVLSDPIALAYMKNPRLWYSQK